jgi:hypothetical protein
VFCRHSLSPQKRTFTCKTVKVLLFRRLVSRHGGGEGERRKREGREGEGGERGRAGEREREKEREGEKEGGGKEGEERER